MTARNTARDDAGDGAPTLAERYARASEELPAKALSRIGGLYANGYWVDDEHYFYLSESFDPEIGRQVDAPWVCDMTSRQARPVISRERLRSLVGEHGGADFTPEDWANAGYDMPSMATLAVSIKGATYLVDIAQSQIQSVEPTRSRPEVYSPDGLSACFLKDYNLWIRNRRTGDEAPLSDFGVPHNAVGYHPENGLAPVSYRANPTPDAIWSDGSEWVLTQIVDERDTRAMAIVQSAPPEGGPQRLHMFKLARRGDEVPTITLLAIHVPTGRIVRARSWPAYCVSQISTRSAWLSAGECFFYVKNDRHFRHVELRRVDLASGEDALVFEESVSDGYIELHPHFGAQPNVRTLAATNEFIWYSERDGWGHLYLHDAATGALKAQITAGEWQVRDIVHLDEQSRRLVFTAGGMDPAADPGLRALCAVSLDGGSVQVLSAWDGDVAAQAQVNSGFGQGGPHRPSGGSTSASPSGSLATVRMCRFPDVARTVVVDLKDGSELVTLCAYQDQHRQPGRLFQALAADGRTPLFGAMFVPSDFDPTRKYPIIDAIYPGPQMAWTPRSPATRLTAQAHAFAELGFVVIAMDTRGVPYRSRAIHQSGYGRQDEPQLSDHVAVINQLCERHAFLDRERVGIVGTSGGGFATAAAMLKYPDDFKAGVSVAGNHDSRNYRSIWMDLYVGPEDGDGSHHVNSTYAHQLKGALMLISGDMDENVPLSQTLELADALIRANKDFELLVVPNAGHLLQIYHAYTQRRIWDFFARTLLQQAPPKEFNLQYSGNEIAGLQRASARSGAWG